MKHITIEIDPDGKLKLEGHEFKGTECDKKMAAFEKELGSVTSKKLKAEYNQTVSTTAQQKVGQ